VLCGVYVVFVCFVALLYVLNRLFAFSCLRVLECCLFVFVGFVMCVCLWCVVLLFVLCAFVCVCVCVFVCD
jgi:hypothetical protein